MASRSITVVLLAATLSASAGAQTLPHPAGCPARLFCGCGAAVEAFGEPRRDLWLASAWLRFPRVPRGSERPGNAVVWPGRHVAVLRQHVSGDTWLLYDANSGRGATQLHERSIRGLVVVDPHAGRP